ncbi:MAG: hypothetical protein R2708_13675 [Vicinamibacterales bacterium]
MVGVAVVLLMVAGRDLGPAGAAHLRQHTLDDGQVGLAIGAQRHQVALQVDLAGHVDRGAVAGHAEGVQVQHLAVEADRHLAAVAEFVVEQPQPQVVDGRGHVQGVRRVDRAPHPHAAAADRRRIGRQGRHQHPRVGVERGIRQAHRHLDLTGLGEAELSRPRCRQARRGDVEAVEHGQAAQADLRRHLTDALLADEQVRDVDLDVVAGLVERAAAGGAEVGEAGQRRQGREVGQIERVDRQPAAVGVERIGTGPGDVGGAGDGAAGLLHLQAVEPDARPLEAQAGDTRGEGLVVGDAAVEGDPSETDRFLVLAVEANLAAERAEHRVVVELESGAEVGQRPLRGADAGVDLGAAVAARIAERELAVDVEARLALGDHGLAHERVGVLDHRLPLERAPGHVPGAHLASAERPLDARIAEVAEHHAVELADAVERPEAVGAAAVVTRDAGQEAMVSCQSRLDTKRQARGLAPVGAAGERHERLGGGEAAGDERRRRRSRQPTSPAIGTGASAVCGLNGPCIPGPEAGLGRRRLGNLAAHRRGARHHRRQRAFADAAVEAASLHRVTWWPDARPASCSPRVARKSVKVVRSTSA